jgi:ubiquinone/menaquinone biosynthesis C-methylase UbiE
MFADKNTDSAITPGPAVINNGGGPSPAPAQTPEQSATPRTMRIFDQSGFYRFVVRSNVAHHGDAAHEAQSAICRMKILNDHPGEYRLLDLACGHAPIAMARAMASFPATTFHYTGIDCNPAQVEGAGHHRFAKNVAKRSFVQGDAWDLSQAETASIDFVYVGLNLHHGTPKEVAHLFSEIRRILKPGGVFFNHDSFRPEGTPLIARPSCNPADANESFVQIPEYKLEGITLPNCFSNQLTAAEAGERDWRRLFVPLFQRQLEEHHGDAAGIAATCKHIWDRDFSLTVSETVALLKAAGFENVSGRYFVPSRTPLGEYYGALQAY